jgi:hypothetical protein
MIAMAGIIALALSGLVLFWRTRPRRTLTHTETRP